MTATLDDLIVTGVHLPAVPCERNPNGEKCQHKATWAVEAASHCTDEPTQIILVCEEHLEKMKGGEKMMCMHCKTRISIWPHVVRYEPL